MANDWKEDSKVQKEDKRHVKSFVVICVLAGILGGIIGLFGNWMHFYFQEINGVWNTYAQLQQNVTNVARILTYVIAFLMLGIGLYFYGRAKKSYRAWDGEEENVIEQVEKNLSRGIVVSNLIYIVLMICFGFATYQMVERDMHRGFFEMFYILSFLVFIFLNIFLQKACINFEKQINPEKRGSVFDFKFRKKWLASCDEAEKRAIYEAAYHSFINVHITCCVLFCCVEIFGMFFKVGLLSYLLIAIIWLVNLITYCVNCLKNNMIA